MPIRFRCNRCRQFLGISQSCAGSIVDCPTCGRALRVPHLDGTVEPLPDPELDLQDSKLVQALEELASMGEAPKHLNEAGRQEPVAARHRDPKDSTAPPPLEDLSRATKEPEAIELPPLPKPVVVQDPAEASKLGQEAAVNLDTLSPLVADEDPAKLPASTTAETSGIDRKPFLTLPTLSILCLVGLLAFAFGYMLGRGAGIGASTGPAPDKETNHEKKFENRIGLPALTGRITYNTPSGEHKPDRGARVIVLPEKRTGVTKLSIVGFRPADQQNDFQVAVAGLRALGGDLANVDEQGNYEIRIKRPGLYHIVLLSRFQLQTNAGPPDQSLQELLQTYFNQPANLLGELSYRHTQIRYRGEGTEPLDHLFERS